jgi:hypothetical protein
VAKLIVSCWRWGSAYSDEYVDKLRAGVARHLKQPYEFKVFAPEPEDEYLTQIPGCMARLRLWDTDWQAAQGIEHGDRLVTLDLDLVVTGPLDELFDRPHPFTILGHANSANPCVYNGSVQMLRAGYRPDMWTDFSLALVNKLPHYQFPDDQGYLFARLGGEAIWDCGPRSGIWSFKKRSWPGGDDLPKGARIVAFPGHRDPSQYRHLDWIQEHWRT